MRRRFASTSAREDAMTHASMCGYAALFSYWIRMPGPGRSVKFAIRCAAFGGHSAILKWALTLPGARRGAKSLIYWAAYYADAKNIKAIRAAMGALGARQRAKLFECVVVRGKLAIVEECMRLGADPCARDHAAIAIAARDDHLSIVQCLWGACTHGLMLRTGGGLMTAAMHGRLDVFDWLAAQWNDPMYLTVCMDFAAQHGHTAIVERLLELHLDPSTGHNTALSSAAERGHVRVMDALLADPRVMAGPPPMRGFQHAGVLERLLGAFGARFVIDGDAVHGTMGNVEVLERLLRVCPIALEALVDAQKKGVGGGAMQQRQQWHERLAEEINVRSGRVDVGLLDALPRAWGTLPRLLIYGFLVNSCNATVAQAYLWGPVWAALNNGG